jgi:hypothetical protein
MIMANIRQREKAIKDVAMYFAEKGKVLTQAEYINAKDKPVPFSGIRRVFRSYSRMLDMIKRNQPELLEFATKKPEPVVKAPEVKVPEFKTPVPPKVAVKPTTVVSKDT